MGASGTHLWLLEGYLSTSFFLGMASSVALRRVFEAMADPEVESLLPAAQAATAHFFQFIVEAMATV
jgi:hypothetical protein